MEHTLGGPAEGLHGLQEVAAAAQAQAAAEAAAAAAAGGQPQQHGQEPYHQQDTQPQQGHQEPALQAEESLMELPEGAETKRCAACRTVKPVSEYYKDRTHSRGIKTRCKECLRACKEAFKNQQRAKSAAEQVTVSSKKCSHCAQEKPASEFSRSSYQRTGLRSWCKECSSKSKKQAKAEGRWKSYDSKAKQARKCRKCEQVRQPEEFPIDPRNPSKRTRDCHMCLEESVGVAPGTGLAQQGAVDANNAMMMAHGAWAPHLGEYWQADQAARAQQMQQGLAAAEYQQNPPASESLMRILRAAMQGNGEEPRRMTPELLSQLGVYADPNDPFSELPPDAQAAVIQQFVEQQQQRHNNALLQGHPGFAPEMLYQREGVPGMGFAPPGQRPQNAEQAVAHMGHYADQAREAAEAHEQPHEAAAAADVAPRRNSELPAVTLAATEAGLKICTPELLALQEHGHGEKEQPQHGHTLAAVGHFEQLRNVPYATEGGWQPPHHLQHHQHPQQLLPGHDWPSAFAPTHRQAPMDAGQGSPKRQRTDAA